MAPAPALAEARAAAEAAALLSGAARVALVAHVSPDGDAIGSLLGLGAILRRLGKAVVMACDDGVPPLYAFMPHAADVVREPPPAEAYDVAVAVDCGDLPRAGGVGAAFVASGRPVVNLDHHVTNTRFGSVNWIDPAMTSTAEIVLALADELGVPLDTEIATDLMVGLLTDTQGFRTSNVNARSLSNASRLAEAGAPVAELSELTLNRRSFRALCLWSQALDEMRFEPVGLLWTHVTQAMRRKCGIPEGGESNLSSFLLSAEEVCASALFIERTDGSVEMSFRAKPGYDVAAVARSLGGGGHPPAAGAMVAGQLAEVEELVLARLRKALEEQKTGA